jgi:hypothetical protein
MQKQSGKVVFEKKVVKNPLEIICHACALMIYWSGLFAELDKIDRGGQYNAKGRQGSPRGSTHKIDESAASGRWQSVGAGRRLCVTPRLRDGLNEGM